MSIENTFKEFATGKNLDTNPFQQEDGKLYLRYDGLQIRNNDAGGISVGFCWQGEPRVFLPLDTVRIENNAIINIVGIEGRQKIDIQQPEPDASLILPMTEL